jgi:hypothetical protein
MAKENRRNITTVRSFVFEYLSTTQDEDGNVSDLEEDDTQSSHVLGIKAIFYELD